MKHILNRRAVLRGAMGSAVFAVGLPLLDCFVNTNGTALASGAPLPIRFGTWFWGLGVTPVRFFPTKAGKNYELLPETQSLAQVKGKVSILSGFNASLDGNPNFPHGTGGPTIRSGTAPNKPATLQGPSFDVLIAEAISGNSRFRSVDLSPMKGGASNSNSGLGPGRMNPSEDSALAFYNRLFGPEFRDPNALNFTPDPKVAARRSVLSAVGDQRKSLEARVGAADRMRLDEYFTSLRQVENQLALQLQAPAPMPACKVPEKVPDVEAEVNVETVAANHRVMTKLLTMALMCDQTRVFNMNFNNGASNLTRPGSTITHHQLTHEEAVDAKLGYQPEATKFVERIMQEWGFFVTAMDGIPEGDGTLLDHMLIVAHSETCFAKIHTVESLPIMFAGRAGGRINSGLHVAGRGDTVSRAGLTAMQAMGLSLDSWGTGGNETKKTLTEILS
ncbi:MAG TPA: DUF1552 domain-containing protein [Steroidobacteraceae bacterium]|nr:DUF1552 domain-containing protein [Steroidobacteraceae bacterium]